MPSCSVCKTKYEPKYNTLQPVCNDFGCMAKHATSKRKTAKKAKDKVSKDLKKKVQDGDVRNQKKLTQTAFNKMRVLEEKIWFRDRGIEPYCISCGKTHMDWCCGHYKTVGAQAILRFDPNNTFLQCNRYCNLGLSGNIAGNKNTIGYTKGILLRFGGVEGQFIIDYCETTNEPRSYDTPWLKQFRKQCNARIRSLENMLE